MSVQKKFPLWLAMIGLLLMSCSRNIPVAPPPPPPAAATPSPSQDHFVQTIPFEAPNYNLTKMELTGRTGSSVLATNGLSINDFTIRRYRLVTNSITGRVTNALDLTVSAPQCLLNSGDQEASSPGPLTVETGDPRFKIEGTGFIWRSKGSNAVLFISNNVVTTIDRGLLSTNSPETFPPSDITSEFIHIHSDAFRFDQNAGLITYTGNVHVEDGPRDLHCDLITLHRAAAAPISDLVADGNIVLVDNSTGSRTTGDHAVYNGTPGAQLVTLTGHPHWQDGPSDATARQFVFEGTRRIFRAEGDAHARMPSGSMSGNSFALLPQSAAAANKTPDASQLIDVYADSLILFLPPTNGPAREVIADSNVRILDAQAASQASGDHAYYMGSNGLFTLSGNARYESPQAQARADVLEFDNLNRSFAALTNAYLKFPVSTLGQSRAFGGFLQRNPASTNQSVEATSDSYDFRNDVLTFHQQVNARLLDGDTLAGTLACGNLAVMFKEMVSPDGHTNSVVQGLTAQDNVHLRQPPTVLTNGKTVESAVDTQRVEMSMWTNGLLKSALATGGLHATRNEIPPVKVSGKAPQPTYLTLDARDATATFRPDTNAVDTVTLMRDVVITRDEGKASGGKLVYTAYNDLAVLSENHPRVEQAGKVSTSETAITYEPGINKFTIEGTEHTVVGLTNFALTQSNFPLIPGQKTK
jgi:lipopolysaccharide transport protein LptA